jgi:hypothetical protein
MKSIKDEKPFVQLASFTIERSLRPLHYNYENNRLHTTVGLRLTLEEKLGAP